MLTTVAIQPVPWKTGQPNITNLGVKLISDNLKDTAQVYWEVYVGTAPNLQSIDRGNEIITGTDYSGWTGDNTFPFTYMLNKLGLSQ